MRVYSTGNATLRPCKGPGERGGQCLLRVQGVPHVACGLWVEGEEHERGEFRLQGIQYLLQKWISEGEKRTGKGLVVDGEPYGW